MRKGPDLHFPATSTGGREARREPGGQAGDRGAAGGRVTAGRPGRDQQRELAGLIGAGEAVPVGPVPAGAAVSTGGGLGSDAEAG